MSLTNFGTRSLDLQNVKSSAYSYVRVAADKWLVSFQNAHVEDADSEDDEDHKSESRPWPKGGVPGVTGSLTCIVLQKRLHASESATGGY